MDFIIHKIDMTDEQKKLHKDYIESCKFIQMIEENKKNGFQYSEGWEADAYKTLNERKKKLFDSLEIKEELKN